MLAAAILSVALAVGGCDAPTEEATRRPAEPVEPPDPEEPTDPPVPPDPPEPGEPTVDTCGIPDTTRSERLHCERDEECILSDINFRNCRDDMCGPGRYPYNCEFAARLHAHCDESSCDDGMLGGSLGCGRGGAPSFWALCVDGVCTARVASRTQTTRPLSIDGALQERDVRRSVRRQLRRIESCFSTGPDEERDYDGVLVLDISISPTGAVLSTSDVNQTIGDASLLECVSAGVRAVTFSASTDGEPVRMRYLFGRPPPRSGCAP